MLGPSAQEWVHTVKGDLTKKGPHLAVWDPDDPHGHQELTQLAEEAALASGRGTREITSPLKRSRSTGKLWPSQKRQTSRPCDQFATELRQKAQDRRLWKSIRQWSGNISQVRVGVPTRSPRRAVAQLG